MSHLCKKRKEVDEMESKRMAGDYTIILSTTTLAGECVIGENINAKPGFEYMVADYRSNELFGNYENIICSDKYDEILQLYGERIADAANEFYRNRKNLEQKFGDISPIQKSFCQPVSYEDNIVNKIAVISPEKLKRGCINSANQIILITGGFGASSNARGQKIFAKNIASGKNEVWTRQDIMGIISFDNLPLWAQNKLQHMENSEYSEDEIEL